jgi:lysyl-tRNA synthetase class 2
MSSKDTIADIKDKVDNEKQYYEARIKDLQIYKKDGNFYPHKFHTDIDIKTYINKYNNTLANGEKNINIKHSLGGRVNSRRDLSKKLSFMDIIFDGYKLQVFCNKAEYESDELYEADMGILTRGDIIGVSGFIAKGKTGELSIIAKKITLLAPCLHLIPKTHFGLHDYEIRYKKRYLDMILNPNVQNTFITRAKIMSFLRTYLDNKGFVEVETPTLTTTPGGANAAKFSTYHNDSKQNMFLRIAPELYLKQLIIGGMPKVYEIGKNFRNESNDLTHSTEFEAIEYYEAFADYNDLMTDAEIMISSLVKEITKSYKITYDGKEIDFTPPFKRIDITEHLTNEITKLGFNTKFNELQLDTEQTRKVLINICQLTKINCPEPQTTARLLDKMIGHFIEPLCINPTIVLNQPIIMSSLSKCHRSNTQLAERFEIFASGFELANAYTEQNVPQLQKKAFENQALNKKLGDEEAQDLDEGYIEALEHGLCPTGGFGMGITRILMMLTSNKSIKEVLTFPPIK